MIRIDAHIPMTRTLPLPRADLRMMLHLQDMLTAAVAGLHCLQQMIWLLSGEAVCLQEEEEGEEVHLVGVDSVHPTALDNPLLEVSMETVEVVEQGKEIGRWK